MRIAVRIRTHRCEPSGRNASVFSHWVRPKTSGLSTPGTRPTMLVRVWLRMRVDMNLDVSANDENKHGMFEMMADEMKT